MPAMTDNKIRVGFIGAGANSRKFHVPNLKAQPGVELVAVANRSKESGERVAKEFGIGRVAGDWREIIAAKDIDAVCIGTWPYTHCEMTLAAMLSRQSPATRPMPNSLATRSPRATQVRCSPWSSRGARGASSAPTPHF